MKNVFCLLCFLLATACNSGDSSSQDIAHADAADGGSCLTAYQVCVGDHFLDFSNGKTISERVINEVVASGQFTQSEKDFLAKIDATARPEAEQSLRMQAQMYGARILVAEDASVTDPYVKNTYSEAADFGAIYRTKGCDDATGACVGVEYSVLDEYKHLVSQELLGFRLSDHAFTVRGNYLVNEPADSGGTKPEAVDKLILVQLSGCAKLPGSAHDFCVGDHFTPLVKEGGPEVNAGQEIVAVTIAKAGSSLVTKTSDSIDIYRVPSKPYGIFIPKGCVDGAPDICLPLATGDRLVIADRGYALDGGWRASQNSRPVNFEGFDILGFLVKDASTDDVNPVLVNDPYSYTTLAHDLSNDDVAQSVYHSKGCGTSMKVCVGQIVNLLHPQYANQVTVMGYNNASDLILGVEYQPYDPENPQQVILSTSAVRF